MSISRYKTLDLNLISDEIQLNDCILNEADFKKYFYQVEHDIQKSLFICTLAYCDSIENARKTIDYIQKKYQDATHNCYAFQVGPPKSTSNIGYSDDGEPHGTAGKPMLTSLLYADVGELVAVVTRYFGGIKLGTGGLVRAYQSSVALALETAPIREKVEQITLKITLDYSQSSLMFRIVSEYEAVIVHEEFMNDVCYTISIPLDRQEEFINRIQKETNGEYLLD